MNLFCLICHRYCNCGTDEIIAFSGDRAYLCQPSQLCYLFTFSYDINTLDCDMGNILIEEKRYQRQWCPNQSSGKSTPFLSNLMHFFWLKNVVVDNGKNWELDGSSDDSSTKLIDCTTIFFYSCSHNTDPHASFVTHHGRGHYCKMGEEGR